MIAEVVLNQIIFEWNQAEYGQKTAVIHRWAKVLGVGYDTVYRAIRNALGGKRKKRVDTGKRKNPKINEWTRVVWQLKLRPCKENGMIATDQALKTAIENGKLPPEAGDIHESTYNRIARQLGYNPTCGRYSRFQAKYPNLLHQFDASSSAYFYVARELPNGERILKLHRKAANYKNKPVPTRERPIIYGMVDDHSGAHYARYFAAEGENAAHGLMFLQTAWAKKDNPQITLRGLPRLLYMDNGPVSKAGPVTEFLKRIDVTKINSTPYAARGKGKIERPWLTMWKRFELSFFMLDNWKDFEITLTELNRQFDNYLIEYNQRPHRYQKNISRQQSWETVALRGGVIDISLDALSKVCRREKRTVKGGFFSLDTTEYEVLGLDEGRVWVYEGIFDDRLVVEDMRSHKKYEVKLFKPRSVGQRLEIVKTEAEKIAEESRENITITKSFYQDAPETPANVLKMPVRGKEKEIEDPLKVPLEAACDDGEEQLFETPGERYEWLLQCRAKGGVLEERDKKFMAEFEKTDIYDQLAKTFQRWEKFYTQRAMAAG